MADPVSAAAIVAVAYGTQQLASAVQNKWEHQYAPHVKRRPDDPPERQPMGNKHRKTGHGTYTAISFSGEHNIEIPPLPPVGSAQPLGAGVNDNLDSDVLPHTVEVVKQEAAALKKAADDAGITDMLKDATNTIAQGLVDTADADLQSDLPSDVAIIPDELQGYEVSIGSDGTVSGYTNQNGDFIHYDGDGTDFVPSAPQPISSASKVSEPTEPTKVPDSTSEAKVAAGEGPSQTEAPRKSTPTEAPPSSSPPPTSAPSPPFSSGSTAPPTSSPDSAPTSEPSPSPSSSSAPESPPSGTPSGKGSSPAGTSSNNAPVASATAVSPPTVLDADAVAAAYGVDGSDIQNAVATGHVYPPESEMATSEVLITTDLALHPHV